MIGSPASRGAVASLGGAGRGCLAAASAVSAVSAAIAASVTRAGGPQRRIARVNCAVVNRITMLERLSGLAPNRVSDRDFCITNSRHHLRRQFAPGDYRHVSVAILSYTTCLLYTSDAADE